MALVLENLKKLYEICAHKKRTISKSGNFHVCPLDSTDNADDRSGMGTK